MRFPPRRLAAVAAAGLLAAGCGDAPKSAPAGAAAVAPAGSFHVERLDFAGLDKLVKSHPGKVVLVKVWSLG